jgi:hypothetical protein
VVRRDVQSQREIETLALINTAMTWVTLSGISRTLFSNLTDKCKRCLCLLPRLFPRPTITIHHPFPPLSNMAVVWCLPLLRKSSWHASSGGQLAHPLSEGWKWSELGVFTATEAP